jgi:hypothetical protein
VLSRDRLSLLLDQKAEQVKGGVAEPDRHLTKRLIEPVQTPVV